MAKPHRKLKQTDVINVRDLFGMAGHSFFPQTRQELIEHRLSFLGKHALAMAFTGPILGSDAAFGPTPEFQWTVVKSTSPEGVPFTFIECARVVNPEQDVWRQEWVGDEYFNSKFPDSCPRAFLPLASVRCQEWRSRMEQDRAFTVHNVFAVSAECAEVAQDYAEYLRKNGLTPKVVSRTLAGGPIVEVILDAEVVP